MIPSLTRSNPVMRRTPEWLEGPQPHTYPTGALFESRPPLRKLVVLADADLLSAPDDQTLSRKAILTGLLAHPYIKLFRYRDEGPPVDVLRESYGPPTARLTAARGWAELLPPDAGEGRGLLYADDSSIVYSGIFGAGAAHARRDSASAAYRDRNPEAAADQRERDILAVEIAQVVQADLFVTERPYLFEQPAPIAQGVTLCRTAEALAMTGLYLRSQNEFVIPYVADSSGHTMNEWLCYMVGAVELLPEVWRWSKPRLEDATADTREALTGLREALVQRVQRSLRTRDSFHQAYNLPQRRDAVPDRTRGPRRDPRHAYGSRRRISPVHSRAARGQRPPA